MNKKDILFMCQFFYPEYITSALLPYQTARKFVEDGFRVGVLCGNPKEYIDKKNQNSVTDDYINEMEIKRVNYLQLSRGNKLSRLINYFSFVISVFLKIPMIRKYKAVIIYSNPPILPIVALIANKLFGTEIIFVCYDVYPEIALETEVIAKNSLIEKVMVFINNQLYKKASRIIVLSREMKKFIIENRHVDERIVQIIPNWDTNEKQAEEVAKQEHTDELCITYLGNMGIPQDFNSLLKVMQDSEIKRRNIKFVFAGHGNKKSVIEEVVKKQKLENVEIHGYLQGEDFKMLFDRTDAFILSLKENLNGLAVPSKFYTYLMSNRPIIAIMNQESDIAKDVKQYNLGASFSNRDFEALKNYIIYISEERPTFDYKEVVNEKFTKEAQLDKYSEMLKKLLGGI